ncbi:prostaglandin F2-alpha receptor [Mastacembelus armatus]|uniref:Prostaglandin F2-alpha receptor n=1 Tax=Mastacembelus armatus TaxID=205130 RepID=A0A3Q3KYD2_9TELE|nr:prostaglandin F2-alpha receptor [Mastacembelus armatus]XP_026161072.1 prostaglandin F2-alpha receptor [Mastacembelus armatus]XP_026161073.1 prostaglandin F2-alpha receptor [Mastacembelus armatus]
MSTNESSEAGCRPDVRPSNNTCSQKELSVTASVISMTVGIFSNSLALFILVKSYSRVRIKSRVSFLLFASSLVVTDLLGHIINGSLVLFVYSSHKRWETFDPQRVVCNLFGVCMVFFGLSPLFLGCAMAVERCIGVTRPIFHSTVLAPHHMKMLLALTWLLAALVSMLPVLLWRPYRVQSSRSFCFFHMEEPKDWLDVFLPLMFSMLGLVALLLSIACNTLTSCALLQGRLRRKLRCKGTSYHIEMICQLLAIMLVSCACWGPLLITVIILSTRTKDENASLSLLMVVRMATWNQILDPWVYILLRRAVLRKIFMLLQHCWGSKSHKLHHWQCSVLRSSVETSNSGASPSNCLCHRRFPLPDTAIKSIT